MNRTTLGLVAIATLAVAVEIRVSPEAQAQVEAITVPTNRAITVAPTNDLAVRDASLQIDRMVRNGDLKLRDVREDKLVPGRTHEHLDQYYQGVRIFGGDITRQLVGSIAASMYGVLYQGIDLDPIPALSVEDARAAIARLGGRLDPRRNEPELMILPLDQGGYRLTYRAQVWAADDLIVLFVDANTGAEVFRYSNIQRQAAVQRGKGVLNDDKKVSMKSASGTNLADDQLRPPRLVTYDMKGNLARTKLVLQGIIPLAQSDIASNSTDMWMDGASVDAHTYQGWTYDYYFKRFGRRGLDDRNKPIIGIVHPARRDDYRILSPSDVGSFLMNAFWDGEKMVYGDGLPPGVTDGGKQWNYLAGGLEIVAHELTHGVTEFSSNLIYLKESGALNEAFSDIMGTSIEFFYASQRGRGGNYLLGEDVVTPGGLRSMSNPILYGDPDHFSQRFLDLFDNGEVHSNSAIANQAFYLAIEGGTNRTSGLSVQGVGSANREQIEKVFYRAFTSLLPSNANFGIARVATIQSARDLYGAGSPAERAVTQAWDAVGVQERTVSTATAVAFPVSVAACPTVAQPAWQVHTTVSAGASTLTISRWQLDLFDSTGRVFGTVAQTATDFSRAFSLCGPGSARIPAQSDMCAVFCVGMSGRTNGALQFSFSATDDANRAVTFSTPRVTLSR